MRIKPSIHLFKQDGGFFKSLLSVLDTALFPNLTVFVCASVIENRLDDDRCTLENVLKDNAQFLELAQKYGVNYILIDDKYEINSNLSDNNCTML